MSNTKHVECPYCGRWSLPPIHKCPVVDKPITYDLKLNEKILWSWIRWVDTILWKPNIILIVNI